MYRKSQAIQELQKELKQHKNTFKKLLRRKNKM